jgi:hypothetical protein
MGDNLPGGGEQVDVTAAITQLAGLVQSLQGEVVRMQSQLTTGTSSQTGIGVPDAVPGDAHASQVIVTSQVMGKLKLPQPKSFSSSQHSGAVENYLFDCEQYFTGMGIPDDKRVFCAAGLLDGPIKTWWRHTCTVAQAAGTLDTLFVWGTFRAMLLCRFRAVNASRPAMLETRLPLSSKMAQ